MSEKKQFSKIRIKRTLKKIAEKVPILKRMAILVYKVLGRKPWSFGYSAYKSKMIKDVINNRLAVFNEDTLPHHYGFGIDERIVEYPWFFSKLKRDEKVILDAGSALNHADILSVDLLKNRHLYISTLSYEGFPKAYNVPSYVFEDLREMSYKDEFFDAIVCISTLEHVGMDNSFIYTQDKSKNENDQGAFLTVVAELKRILKKGKTLYLTVPYGKYKNHKWLQVFDAAKVMQVKEAFSPSKASETYFKYENKQWNYSNAKDCQNGCYFDIHHEKKLRKDYLAASQSVVCLELTK